MSSKSDTKNKNIRCIDITQFKLSTKIGVWGKKLGKEEISVELTEWEIISIMRAMARWNKELYKKIKIGLIDEAVKEGYEITFNEHLLKIKCPKCHEEIPI